MGYSKKKRGKKFKKRRRYARGASVFGRGGISIR